MKVYRLVHAIEVERNLPFKPAPNLANRWNNEYSVAYTSDSLALAALEVLGGWGQYDSLDGYHIFAYTLGETDVETALVTNPGLDIHSKPNTKRFGDEWARSIRSLALRVPSVRIQIGFNYLINPHHAEFDGSKVERLGAFHWDNAIAELVSRAKNK